MAAETISVDSSADLSLSCRLLSIAIFIWSWYSFCDRGLNVVAADIGVFFDGGAAEVDFVAGAGGIGGEVGAGGADGIGLAAVLGQDGAGPALKPGFAAGTGGVGGAVEAGGGAGVGLAAVLLCCAWAGLDDGVCGGVAVGTRAADAVASRLSSLTRSLFSALKCGFAAGAGGVCGAVGASGGAGVGLEAGVGLASEAAFGAVDTGVVDSVASRPSNLTLSPSSILKCVKWVHTQSKLAPQNKKVWQIKACSFDLLHCILII